LTVGAPGLFTDTDEAGVYHVTGAGAAQHFAVNIADSDQTTNLNAQPAITTTDHPELNHPAQATAGEITSQVFWLPLAALALALFGGEWLIFCWKRGSA
jgi:hypothetical protein